MSSYVHVVVFVWLAIIPATNGNGGGAPESACGDMSPSHNSTAQSDTSPYTIEIVDGKRVAKGGILKVCVKGRKFKGILLQMRAEGSEIPIGKFNGTKGILANDTKLMKCTADGDTVTHSKPTDKASPTCFYWNAPDNTDPKKSYQFVATIVESKEVYWVKVKSDLISASSGIASGVCSTTLAICSLLAAAAHLLQ